MSKKERYIVTVGGLCMDEYYYAQRWPKEGDKGLIEKEFDMVGGMIPNAAAVFSGYGINTKFYDVMNSGAVTQALLSDLQRYGIDTSMVRFDDSLPDAKCIIVRSGKERTILVVDSKKPRLPLEGKWLEIFRGAAYVYTSISEFKKFENYMDVAKDLKNHGVQIVFDVEPSTYTKVDSGLLEMANVLFFNEFGFEAYCEERDKEVCYQHLFECGVQVITVTLGAGGSYTRTPNAENRTGALHLEVIDTTGAGDTFNSSFVRCLLEGLDIASAAKFANVAAGRSVTKLGPKGGVSSVEDIERMLEEYEELLLIE